MVPRARWILIPIIAWLLLSSAFPLTEHAAALHHPARVAQALHAHPGLHRTSPAGAQAVRIGGPYGGGGRTRGSSARDLRLAASALTTPYQPRAPPL